MLGCSSHTIRNEDALHIMYLVTQGLELQKTKITENLKAAIGKVLAADTCGIDTLALERKITETETKKARLIELYMSAAIGKEEFVELRKKCDGEILKYRSSIESMTAQGKAIEQKEAMLADIFAAVDEIANGAQYDDEFYRHILDRMVVHDRGHIDVYLNFLPHTWSYCLASAVNAGQNSAKTERDTNSPSDTPTGDTQMFRFAHSVNKPPKIGLFMGKITTFERVKKYHPLWNSYDWNDYLSVETTKIEKVITLWACVEKEEWGMKLL